MTKKSLVRRTFIKHGTMAGAGALILPGLLYKTAVGQENESALKDKKVLLTWGGWTGHEPEQCRDIFVPWMRKEGALVTVSDTLDTYVDKDFMDSLDLIIQIWTMGAIEQKQEKGLLDAVRNGTGIAGWHGGLGDSFRQNVGYQFMVGGQWVAHPGGVIDYEVNITVVSSYGIGNFLKKHGLACLGW